MAFIDEIKEIQIAAGKGGNGVVRWRREKFRPLGGPSGGDGGRGGDVILRANRQIKLLNDYFGKPLLEAEEGEAGRKNSEQGRNGENLVLEFPLGTVIRNLETKEEIELTVEGQEELLLKGGRGGLGNEHFKGSKNTTPQEWTPGKKGYKGMFSIEVRLFADAGLIGLPNAGKSTLLNMVTNAQSKVAEYAFTTLEPHLGVLKGGYVIADIPGLIEGASEGKGLGHTFLRHIRRTKMLIHMISFENGDEMMNVYKSIRGELSNYHDELGKKDEVIVLSKTDVAESDEYIEEKKKEFEKLGKEVILISSYDDESLEDFVKKIISHLQD
ncbi:MAG: GTP-binding protein [Flavobacteriaceae bacterium]|jgi:GTP-binding protein